MHPFAPAHSARAQCPLAVHRFKHSLIATFTAPITAQFHPIATLSHTCKYQKKVYSPIFYIVTDYSLHVVLQGRPDLRPTYTGTWHAQKIHPYPPPHKTMYCRCSARMMYACVNLGTSKTYRRTMVGRGLWVEHWVLSLR